MNAILSFSSSGTPGFAAHRPYTVRAFLALAVALAGLGLPARIQAQMDNFEDGDDVGWTHYMPLGAGTAQFTVADGQYSLAASVSPNPAFGGARAASVRQDANYTNFYVAVDLVGWNTTTDQAIGVVARLRQIGAGTTDGYVFTAQVIDQDVSISRLTDERPTDVPGTSLPFVLDPAKDYRLVFQGQGSHLEGRIYVLTNLVTPVLTVTGTDATYTDGYSGVIVADLSTALNGVGEAVFDNYLALDVEPPRLAFGIDAASQVTLAWPSPATAFNLEYAPALPWASWTTVPTNQIALEGTNLVHRTTAGPGTRLYRLNRPMN
jgi:hypothetical protein